MSKMTDGLGRQVKKGDVVFTTSGSSQSISTGLAIAISDEKSNIKRRVVTRDKVWDEPGFNYRGEPDDKYGYYADTERSKQRKFHYENEKESLGSSSHLVLGFSRSIIVNIDDIADDKVREFYRQEQEKLR